MFFKDSRRLIKSEVIRTMFIDTHTLTHHTDVCKRTQTCSHTHTGRELVKRPPNNNNNNKKKKKKNDADWYQTAAAPAVKICTGTSYTLLNKQNYCLSRSDVQIWSGMHTTCKHDESEAKISWQYMNDETN